MSQKISQFTATTTVSSGDFFPIVQASGGANRRVDIGVLDNRYTVLASGLAVAYSAPAQASGNAALVSAATAQASGNAALSGLQSKLNNYTYTVISGNKTLASNERTSVITSGVIVTLPAAPAAGTEVGVAVWSGITNTIVSGNAQRIMSVPEDLTINVGNSSVSLVYINATRGWQIL